MIATTSVSPDGVVLSARNLLLQFGGIVALNDVSIDVRKDELLAIIGPNGAGKSSLMNCLSGFYRPKKGDITLGGLSVRNMAVHEVAGQGLARTFQGTHIFSGMTVVENLMVGRHMHMRSNLAQSFLYFGAARREEVVHREVVEKSSSSWRSRPSAMHQWAASATDFANAWTWVGRWPRTPGSC